MNQFKEALETRRIALSDIGLLAWVKHNDKAIMESLAICQDLEDLRQDGTTVVETAEDDASE